MLGYGEQGSDCRKRICRGFLAAVWMSGLLTGTCLFWREQSLIRDLFCKAFHEPPDRSAQLLCEVPLMLSALAISMKKICWIYPICFLRAAAFSFTVSGVISALSLTGLSSCRYAAFYLYMGRLIEYWFWRRYISGTRSLEPAVLILSAAAIFLVTNSESFLFYGNTY